jgi:hypothetical protein
MESMQKVACEQNKGKLSVLPTAQPGCPLLPSPFPLLRWHSASCAAAVRVILLPGPDAALTEAVTGTSPKQGVEYSSRVYL